MDIPSWDHGIPNSTGAFLSAPALLLNTGMAHYEQLDFNEIQIG
jgi:hypothetical protein